MRSTGCDLKLRFGLHPQGLIRALVAAGCIRVGLALLAGSRPFGVSHAVTAAEWILCVISQMLLALLDWDVQKRHPGINSLFRRCSYGAFAGSLLPNAASLLFFAGTGAAPALTGALVGLALTMFSATLLEWLLRDVRVSGPLPCESVVMAQLAALKGIAERMGP
jgi:hypothetical protein